MKLSVFLKKNDMACFYLKKILTGLDQFSIWSLWLLFPDDMNVFLKNHEYDLWHSKCL